MEQDFPKNQFARHSVELLGAAEGPSNQPKGRQTSQSTTMLHNECTHMFLYVFGHLGAGGFSCTLLCWCLKEMKVHGLLVCTLYTCTHTHTFINNSIYEFLFLKSTMD